jgi:hypothetical protein
MAERETRPCGSHESHVPHPWNGSRRWCEGWGKYAADATPRAVPEPAELCGHRYVGEVNGSVFVCRAPKGHPCDPTKGYAGSGHNLVGVSKAG